MGDGRNAKGVGCERISAILLSHYRAWTCPASQFLRLYAVRCAGCRSLAYGLILLALGAAGDAADVDRGLAEFKQGQFAEALQTWKQAAAAGDPRGALYVGVLYDSGLGVPADKRQTMEWYRRAADGGSAPGAFNVGVLYDSGLGTAANPELAAAWYARAAASGFGRAEYNLGMLYETGIGVPRNREKAASLFRSAAGHGITAAASHLLQLGQPFGGVSQKPQDTAMQDFQHAQQVLLSRGPAEAGRAAALFRQSAEKHNPLAEYDLGYCYEHGLGVPQDQAQAYKWYRRSLADSSDEGLRSLAQLGASNLEERVRHAELTSGAAGRSPQVSQMPRLKE